MSKKRRAIVVDIDGTLADMGKGQPDRRGPYAWDRVDEDDPKMDVIELVQLMMAGRRFYDVSLFGSHRMAMWDLIVTSGRKEQCRRKTATWLHRVGIHYDYLF